MYNYIAKVDRVVDGDTMDVSIDLGFDIWHKVRLRLAHVDAYEVSTELGKKAKAIAVAVLEGKDVQIITSKADKYGRYLAEIIVDGESFNKTILNSGLAVPYEGGKR